MKIYENEILVRINGQMDKVWEYEIKDKDHLVPGRVFESKRGETGFYKIVSVEKNGPDYLSPDGETKSVSPTYLTVQRIPMNSVILKTEDGTLVGRLTQPDNIYFEGDIVEKEYEVIRIEYVLGDFTSPGGTTYSYPTFLVVKKKGENENKETKMSGDEIV